MFDPVAAITSLTGEVLIRIGQTIKGAEPDVPVQPVVNNYYITTPGGPVPERTRNAMSFLGRRV